MPETRQLPKTVYSVISAADWLNEQCDYKTREEAVNGLKEMAIPGRYYIVKIVCSVDVKTELLVDVTAFEPEA